MIRMLVLAALLAFTGVARAQSVAAVGSAAPSFSAPDQSGATVKLEDLKGKRVVLWFFPKADTPG